MLNWTLSQGDPGLRGDRGAPGLKGMVGATGDQGRKGEMGAKGQPVSTSTQQWLHECICRCFCSFFAFRRAAESCTAQTIPREALKYYFRHFLNIASGVLDEQTIRAVIGFTTYEIGIFTPPEWGNKLSGRDLKLKYSVWLGQVM